MRLSELSFPVRSRLVFDRTVVDGWYDGLTSGIAHSSRGSEAYRLDIVTWGPRQEIRIFALSPLAEEDFEKIVELLRGLATTDGQAEPDWPIWFATWPTWNPESTPTQREIEVLLSKTRAPEYAVASDSMFETLFAVKELNDVMRSCLPAIFNDQPATNDFDAWKNFLNFS